MREERNKTISNFKMESSERAPGGALDGFYMVRKKEREIETYAGAFV
jgi:hypothetical protein